jgi:CubicO group peptidase (beta-lactamase class C family)
MSFGQPMLAPPGEKYRYSTGNAHLLSVALTHRSGVPTREFAERHLFGPAGIVVSLWKRDAAGFDFGGVQMFMTPRNLARFAYLYLDGGRLGGRQIIPEDWVVRSTRSWTKPNPEHFRGDYDYGYFWWLERIAGTQIFIARGWGAQTIYVVPAARLLILTSGKRLVLEHTAARNSRAVRNRIEDFLADNLPPLIAPGPDQLHCPVYGLANSGHSPVFPDGDLLGKFKVQGVGSDQPADR